MGLPFISEPIVKFSKTSFNVKFFLRGDIDATVRTIFLMEAFPYKGNFIVLYITIYYFHF